MKHEARGLDHAAGSQVVGYHTLGTPSAQNSCKDRRCMFSKPEAIIRATMTERARRVAVEHELLLIYPLSPLLRSVFWGKGLGFQELRNGGP